MSEYPNPDEEFELLYGDELELLREQDEEELHESPIRRVKTTSSSTCTTTINTQEHSRSTANNSVSLFSTLPSNQSQDIGAVTPPVSCHEFTTTSLDSLHLDQQIDSSSSRKRTADELFGDIGDLDFDDFDFQPIKKVKTKDEELRDLMEHIILLRKLGKEKNILSVGTNGSSSSINRDKFNISSSVPRYPFIGLRCHDGERIYIRFHSEEYEKEEIQKVVKDSTGRDILGDSKKKIWEDAQILLDKQVAAQLQENVDLEIIERSDQEQLWTDLYKPRKYVELLSDESTNRIMLKWLKLWDKVVFNRKPKIHPIKAKEKNKFNFGRKFELNTELDEHGRPHHKVALLCGPPGLGKTTLAHVVARHAGYNVVEINASDDRSTEAFKKSLENATQMKSMIDREGRPNCVIFDEIDGAPQSSIDYLIKFVNGTVTSRAKKGKKQTGFVLKRPVICICNDVYVPALRPLRQIAFVIHFPFTSSTRLAERLMSICRREQIKTDIGAMIALAEKSNNDIRSCLSVLHFFKVQNKSVTLSDIYRFDIGQKDLQKGLFSVWQVIFRVTRSKLNPLLHQTHSTTKQTVRARMETVLQTICSFGDYDRVMQGVYENIPHLKLNNSTMEACSQAMDWFVFTDMLNKQIYSLQNYSLSPYLPYAFVVWHFLFATPQGQKLTYPSVGYENKQKEIRRKAVLSEILRGMQPSVRANCYRLALLLDVIPLLFIIISPKFRPVSLHLYTKEEKDSMLNVVNVMIDYNLNYVQERMPDGNYLFNLEPNINELVSLDKSGPHRKVLSYSNRQLIAREIELEKMRKFEKPNENSKKSEPAANIEKSKTLDAANQLPNHLQTLKAKTLKISKPTVAKDFFGRIITKTKSPSSDKTSMDSQTNIWYQYKEGYNNAVRKKITLQELL